MSSSIGSEDNVINVSTGETTLRKVRLLKYLHVGFGYRVIVLFFFLKRECSPVHHFFKI